LRFRFAFLLVALVVPLAAGQVSETSPSDQQEMPLVRPSGNLLPDELSPRNSRAGDQTAAAPQPDPPMVTMLPHSETSPYWISGQANIIFQAHPAFHSPYEGQNSLVGRGEYKTSLIGTLFLGYEIRRTSRYTTDFLVDFESAGGRGLSQALGLAGFTNLDVVRNPNLGSKPYLARYQIYQTLGLTNDMVESERGPFSLAAQVPARRVTVRVGKMSMADFFDVNSVGSDSHLQFTNWTVDNNGAWDYAADTRGYTTGGIVEYQDRAWGVRYGFAAMPVVANGIDLDWAFSRAHAQNGEVEIRKSLVAGHHGTTRLLTYANNAHMGVYSEAVNAYLEGIDPKPLITAHEHFGALKYGFGFNNEQEVTDHLRLFSRFGWNEGKHESFAYTEVDQTIEFGGDYTGAQWGRPVDRIGVAFVSNAIKKDHQNYLKLGGLGFLLGDGSLNYGREDIVEGYYNLHAWRGVFYALGLTHVAHPGYNRDRGPVWVPSVRMHVDF
jgi:high affinity Mn2+ porin